MGQMAAIALLQNGQAPRYFSEDLLNDILSVKRERVVTMCLKTSSRTRHSGYSYVCQEVPDVPLLAEAITK